MAKLTEAQRKFAVQIIKAGSASLSKDSDPDYVVAAAFVFDNGIFFLGREGSLEIAAALQEQGK